MKIYVTVFTLMMSLIPLIIKAIPVVKQVAEQFGDLTWDEKLKKAIELFSKMLADAGQPTVSQSAINTSLHLAHQLVKNGAEADLLKS